ncbi:EVE domain-containing protein [Reichenbachiella versicolor]|uniref:EVE domain-containing protein n=1 Tax=Reichenbachiella versicolor TaxID=1821036 RepID=UPI000D6E473E|nr:EVE domain-containing protein [Reichenbachiella versicolor]
MKYWLIKTEPDTYSWNDLVKLGRDHWDGIRNYAARNAMKEMKEGDLALFYHSGNEKAIVGIAKCVQEYYQDPTTDDDKWVVVDFIPEQSFNKKIFLSDVKNTEGLSEMVLVKNSRLSVQSVRADEFELIIKMSHE